jgi:serine protease Do
MTDKTQNNRLTSRVAKTGGAVLLGAMLAIGAGWHSFAADSRASTAPAAAAQSTPAITHAVAGARDSYADVVNVVAPAVVTIRTESKARVSPTQFGNDDEDLLRRFFGEQFGRRGPQMPRNFRQRALGSGVVVTGDGYILTNNHVIDQAEDIRVEFTDGRSFKAKLVGSDKPSDLALLKIDAANLRPLALGNSDAVQVGDVVLAVGNPLGIGQTVTMGIISAKGRSTKTGDGSYEDFLQTDAPINHGNSGGALVNTKGELVGINSQIMSPNDGNIGIGFAIPANMARHVMDGLRKDGKVHRAQLGVTVQPVTADMAESLGLKQPGGAIVSSVTDGSAADKAGVKRGDVIKSFNSQPVQDFNSLRNRVADAAPGSTATLGIIRDGKDQTLNLRLGEVQASRSAGDDNAPATDDKAALGVAVEPLTPELASRSGLPRDAKGIVIQQVNPDGRGAEAGLQPGDVILEVNRQPVTSIDELRNAVRKTADRPTLLLVHRNANGNNADIFVTVRPS